MSLVYPPLARKPHESHSLSSEENIPFFILLLLPIALSGRRRGRKGIIEGREGYEYIQLCYSKGKSNSPDVILTVGVLLLCNRGFGLVPKRVGWGMDGDDGDDGSGFILVCVPKMSSFRKEIRVRTGMVLYEKNIRLLLCKTH